MPPKKLRPITSCTTCRKRRVRCDKIRPVCGRCRTGNIECTFINVEDDIEPTVGTESGQNTQYQENVLDDDEQEGARPASAPPRPRDVPESYNSKDGRLYIYPGGRNVYQSPMFWGSAIPDVGIMDDTTSSSTTFPRWPSSAEGDLDLQNPRVVRLRLKKIKAMNRNTTQNCSLCGRPYNLRCVLAMIPSKELAAKLCDVFLTNVYPLTPILHLPTFITEYRMFWTELGQHDPHSSELGSITTKKPAFIALLLSILFAGMIASSNLHGSEGNNRDTDMTVGDLYFLTTVSLRLVGFPRRPTLYALAAYIFSQTQILREEEFAESSTFISTAFRVALRMGLYRDDEHFHVSEVDSEIRRRLWWHVIHLDGMASASSGLSPFFIDEKMANIALITPYEDLSPENTKGNRKIDIRHLVAVSRYRISKEMRYAIKSHFDSEVQTPNQLNKVVHRLIEMANEISNVMEMLLDLVSKTPRGEEPHLDTPTHAHQRGFPKGFSQVWTLNSGPLQPSVTAFASWATLLLHLMVHRAFCVLYQPLFRNEKLLSSPEIRTRTLQHAQAYLQLFVRICEDPISDPYRWMYPQTYQPLQALSLLLADLLEHPQSAEASTSRGLIDATFELYEADEGIVGPQTSSHRNLSSTSKEAWSMLIKTRRKALEQDGQDSHVLLPSHAPRTNTCICGETIAVTQTPLIEPTPRRSISRVTSTASQPPSERQTPVDIDPFATNPMGFDPVGFDWNAWDATLERGADFLP